MNKLCKLHIHVHKLHLSSMTEMANHGRVIVYHEKSGAGRVLEIPHLIVWGTPIILHLLPKVGLRAQKALPLSNLGKSSQ